MARNSEAGTDQLQAHPIAKKRPPKGPFGSYRWARRELLFPIDRASKVVAHTELEERQNAVEQKLRVGGEHRFLCENGRASRLDLDAKHSEDRSTTSCFMHSVDERVVRESVHAVQPYPRIADYGDHVPITCIRGDATEVLR